MKRLAALLMALLCMCSFAFAEGTVVSEASQAATAAAQENADYTLITAVGKADATAAIDIATLVFSVEASGETVAEANQLVMTSINTITNLLKAEGVEEDAIWHRNYNVEPNVVYHNTKLTGDKVIEGYTVEIVLCVRLTDINLVGVVIDAAMQSGAGSTHELEFERSTALDVYNSALTAAAAQAMEKAKVMAEGCGLELGALVSVSEFSQLEDGEAVVEVTYLAK